jgi:hypothetical protein
VTWKPVTGGGLPSNGRFRAAVAPNSDGRRMYLDGGGFYRSDDGGATWKQPTTDRRVGNERVIVDTIRRQARHEDTQRWDTIEFKL